MPLVRAVVLSAAILMILLVPIAHAGDSTWFEILSFELGMAASEVLQQLHGQGINGAAIEQRRPACAPTPTTACVSMIDARTRDGRLHITLVGTKPDAPAGQEVVLRITYRIIGRGPAANADATGVGIVRCGAGVGDIAGRVRRRVSPLDRVPR